MKIKIVYFILILSASQCAFFQTPLFSQRPADKFLFRTFHFDQDSLGSIRAGLISLSIVFSCLKIIPLQSVIPSF